MLKARILVVVFSGIATVIFFTIALLVGGSYYPQYSQLYNEVSLLFLPHSPVYKLVTPLFILYEWSLFVFSGALFLRSRFIFTRIGSLLLFMSGLLSLSVWSFPSDIPGTPLTAIGAIHLQLVTLLCIFTVGSLLSFSISFRHYKNLYWMSAVSFFTAIFFAVSAVYAGLNALTKHEMVGLMERLPFAAFFIWVSLLSIGMLFSDHRVKHFFSNN